MNNARVIRGAPPRTNPTREPDGVPRCRRLVFVERVYALRALTSARRTTTFFRITAGVLLMGAAAAVEPARGGTYVMRNCDVPGHRNALMYPWLEADNVVPGVSLVDACATGGGVGFNLGADRQFPGGRNLAIQLIRPLPPRDQIKFVKVVLWYAARLTSTGQSINLWAGQVLADGSYVVTLSNGPPGSEYLVAEQQLSPDAKMYEVGIHCGPPDGVQSPEPCVAANAVPMVLRGMEVTLSEDVPPIVSAPGGSIMDGASQSGMRSVTYSANDRQSGLSRVDVLLDDTVVASRDLTAQCQYADFTVCPESRDETLQVDTRAVADGPHRLTIRARDAAGNEQLVHGHSAVLVANPLNLVGTPVSGYQLSARFKGSGSSTLTVPYGRRVLISGRLSQGSRPVRAGIPVELLERVDRRRAREVSTGHFKTRADGSFSARVKTTRPSRTVRLAYRPDGGSPVVSRRLRLRIRAASSLRASLRGRVIRFSGRVLSRPIPRDGARILMEGRSPGSAWTAFRTLRTDRNGRFSGSYRLRVRRPGVLLKIRAVVRSQKEYGYVSAQSRFVALRVR